MIEWLKNIFRKTKVELYGDAKEAYHASLDIAHELDTNIDHTLDLTSRAQIAGGQEIDALIAEMTKRKQEIAHGAMRAEKLQAIQAQLRAALEQVHDAIEDVGAAI